MTCHNVWVFVCGYWIFSRAYYNDMLVYKQYHIVEVLKIPKYFQIPATNEKQHLHLLHTSVHHYVKTHTRLTHIYLKGGRMSIPHCVQKGKTRCGCQASSTILPVHPWNCRSRGICTSYSWLQNRILFHNLLPLTPWEKSLQSIAQVLFSFVGSRILPERS